MLDSNRLRHPSRNLLVLATLILGPILSAQSAHSVTICRASVSWCYPIYVLPDGYPCYCDGQLGYDQGFALNFYPQPQFGSQPSLRPQYSPGYGQTIQPPPMPQMVPHQGYRANLDGNKPVKPNQSIDCTGMWKAHPKIDRSPKSPNALSPNC